MDCTLFNPELHAGIQLVTIPLRFPVYKDIHSVMVPQSDLVETLARFDPKIVKAGELPEDQKIRIFADVVLR